MFMSKQNRKKQRGQWRKLKSMFRNIDNFKLFTKTSNECEHFHVPSSMFIESSRTSRKVKTEFFRKWIKTAEAFISEKPVDIPFCKVVAVLSVPNYWSSQITVFYDENYFNSFWKRTESEQFWIPIKQEEAFCKKRNIITSLKETGYHEIIIDEDENTEFENDLWFYGDLK